jgi:hypothetical protein
MFRICIDCSGKGQRPCPRPLCAVTVDTDCDACHGHQYVECRECGRHSDGPVKCGPGVRWYWFPATELVHAEPKETYSWRADQASFADRVQAAASAVVMARCPGRSYGLPRTVVSPQC